MIRVLATVSLIVIATLFAHTQEYASFNMLIEPDYLSAEKTVDLYQGIAGRPAEIAALRGSQIAVATTAFITQQPLTIGLLEKSLEDAKFNQSLGDDPFKIREARQNVAAIKELLLESQ